MKSQSFLNLTASALGGLFGLHASLSELAGDDIISSADTSCCNEPETAITPLKTIGNYNPFLDDVNRLLARVTKDSSPLGRTKNQIPLQNLSPQCANKKKTKPSHTTLTGPSESTKPTTTILLAFLAVVFVIGINCGKSVLRLHEKYNLSLPVSLASQPVNVYSLIWGIQAILASMAFPYLDRKFLKGFKPSETNDWASSVRIVFAFLGTGLVVRQQPWNMPSQIAAISVLAGPLLWYFVDGTSNGLILSLVTSIGSGAFLFALELLLHASETSTSTMALAKAGLIACELFYCSICFGNVSRRVGPLDEWKAFQPYLPFVNKKKVQAGHDL